ncbi:hypothetical protein BDF21DRAFT_402838 [Thamnidium elegans]|nr:hypothetical protein BDF21DRAFT_402838 [Thamnidium elegans]
MNHSTYCLIREYAKLRKYIKYDFIKILNPRGIISTEIFQLRRVLVCVTKQVVQTYSKYLKKTGYLDPEMHTTEHTGPRYRNYPENVSKVELADPSNMPLARFCSELETPEPIYNISTGSTRKMVRKFQQDKVIESPRLLPFPYHNDSYFLPTAEHDYPGGFSVTDGSSSMVSLSVYTTGSRQHLSNNSTNPSLYHPQQRGYQRQLLSSPSKSHFYSKKRYDDDTLSNYSNKRRAISVTPSSPSTLREDTIVPQRKRRSNNRFALKFKQKLLGFKSSNSTILEYNNNSAHLQHPLSSSASIISNTVVLTTNNTTTKVKQQRYESLQYNTPQPVNSAWYEKLWKFIKPASLVKKDNRSSTSTKAVWYSQFRCNPPPPTGITLLS